MGHIHQDVKVTAESTRDLSMFVDTGATFSVLPEALADELGVHRLSRTYRIGLADGSPIEMDVGTVILTVLNRTAPSTVLIGNVPEPILGVEALEALGLTVDPAGGKLIAKRGYAVRLGGIR
jgi:predicted aspartyl protease